MFIASVMPSYPLMPSSPSDRTVCVCVLVTQLCPTLRDPMGCVAHQAPFSVGFTRQEYWSGLPFPSLIELVPSKKNSQ